MNNNNNQFGKSCSKFIKHCGQGRNPYAEFLTVEKPGQIKIVVSRDNIKRLFSSDNTLAQILTENDKFVEPNYAKDVVGFWYPSKNDAVDNKYKVPEFGNFYHTNISIEIYGFTLHFTNVEALFHGFKLLFIDATNKNNKLFNKFYEFQNMTGDKAYHESKKYALQLDVSWHKCKYSVMYLLLSAKFGYHYIDQQVQYPLRTICGERLLETKDAYLAEYTPNNEEWGFNYNTNKGNNWLGRLLMIKRRELGGLGKPSAPNSNLSLEMYHYQIIKNEMNGQNNHNNHHHNNNNNNNNQPNTDNVFPSNEIKQKYETIENKLIFQNTNFNKGYAITQKYVPNDTTRHSFAIKLNICITDQSFINHLLSNVKDIDIFNNKLNVIYFRNISNNNNVRPNRDLSGNNNNVRPNRDLSVNNNVNNQQNRNIAIKNRNNNNNQQSRQFVLPTTHNNSNNVNNVNNVDNNIQQNRNVAIKNNNNNQQVNNLNTHMIRNHQVQSNLPFNTQKQITQIQHMLDFQNGLGKNYEIQSIMSVSGHHSYSVMLNNDITPGFATYLKTQGFDVYLQQDISHKNKIIYF